MMNQSESQNKSSRNDPIEDNKRIELIQDFSFQTLAHKICVTPDSKYAIAAGIYPSCVKIFDFDQLSLKVLRGVDGEIIQLRILSNDYSKFALLLDDRNIELHAQYGKHFKIRIPKYGRDMIYIPSYAEILSAGSSSSVYRLNLEQGQFLESYEAKATAINCLAYSNSLNLVTIGAEDGFIEMWDLRTNKKEISIPEDSAISDLGKGEISAISFSNNGLEMAFGNSLGEIRIYDIRNPILKHKIKFQYELPIKQIKYEENIKKILINDSKILKIFDLDSYKLFSYIEPSSPMNCFEHIDKTGLIFMACNTPKIQVFFVPSMGFAPKWCSFLDSMAEELQEKVVNSIYEDYKFLTKADLQELNASHLIGTDKLKAHMHGFLINYKLYTKLKMSSEPFNYEEYQREKLNEKFNKEFSSRIVINKIQPRVNLNYLNDLIKKKDKNSKKSFNPEEILEDKRFEKLFSDKTFLVDENDPNYVLAHNSSKKRKNFKNKEIEEIEEVEEPEDLIELEEREENEDSDDLNNAKKRKQISKRIINPRLKNFHRPLKK